MELNSSTCQQTAALFCMYRWFYGDITADHAKQILLQTRKHGSFLVRSRQTVEHQFALSICLDNDVIHVIVVFEVCYCELTDTLCWLQFV